MGVIRYKLWNDLWHHKGRTVQVVLIIAMGALALGAILGGRNLFQARVGAGWQASNPAMINLVLDPPVKEVMLTSLENIEGISHVEGFMETTLEWRSGPDQPWQVGVLAAREDYEAQVYNRVRLTSGDWPRGKSFAMEQGGITFLGLREGQAVDVRLNDREYRVQLAGTVSDLNALPPGFGGNAQFYTTRERFAQLTGQPGFNRVLAGAPVFEMKHVTALADRLQRRLEKQGVEVRGAAPPQDNPIRVADPATYFIQTVMDGLFLIMGVMAVLALGLGLLLVYNTISVVIQQQVNQIGVMKAVGARLEQVLLIYLANILVYGLLACLVAVPVGALAAYGLHHFMASLLNINPGPLAVSLPAVVIQVVVALLSPLLAALVPVLRGARITVREAISTYGLTVAAGLLDRLLARSQAVPRMVVLAISNTFRNKGRLLLTQITLIGSGLIFMMVVSVRDSVIYTFDEVMFDTLRFNVVFQFEGPERIETVEGLTRAYPGVTDVEMWGLSGPKVWPASRAEAGDDQDGQVFGLPLPTVLYQPELRAGRWLKPEDTYAIALNQKFANQLGVAVGDWVVLDHGPYGESEWQVVGLIFNPLFNRSAYVPRDTLLKEIRSVNRASTIWMQTERQDAAGEAAMAESLRTYYARRGLELNNQGLFFGRETATQLVDLVMSNFGIILALLAVMAVVIGLVGAVALSGVLSLSVLERRREIGVMRAIGASSGSIVGLFISEGVLLGWLSWLVALGLSFPAGALFTNVLGSVIDNEIIYRYTATGPLLWLVVITVLAALASWFPAAAAARISVRESLAYQ